MSPTLTDRRPPNGGKSAPDKNAKKAPRLVLGLGGSVLAAKAAARFRAMGWDVTNGPAGEEARRLAVRGKAHVLVLAAGPGLLETAKLVTALPKRTRVILVSEQADARLARVSVFLGAGFVTEADGVESLVEAVLSTCAC